MTNKLREEALAVADGEKHARDVSAYQQNSSEVRLSENELAFHLSLAYLRGYRAKPVTDTTEWCLIETFDLERLRRVEKRLYSENRLNGNEMRNLAQILTSVRKNAEK